jgi:hypothetical protein
MVITTFSSTICLYVIFSIDVTVYLLSLCLVMKKTFIHIILPISLSGRLLRKGEYHSPRPVWG